MFDPDEFWRFAERLLGAADSNECDARVAAGRAYYAFFLTIRRSIEHRQPGTFLGRAGDHSRAVRLLRQRRRYQLAEALAALYELRELADYDLDGVVDQTIVSLEIDQARTQYENAKVF